jgi:RNA polymerase sigma factor (sigma-70 family)
VVRASNDVPVVQLVEGARRGDETCWDALVARFSALIWSVARGFGMSAADAAEVSQTTWLRLAEHLWRIETPDRLAAWLVTTTRRECMRQRRLHGRQVLVGHTPDEVAAAEPGLDARVLSNERDAVLWRCIQQLPERSRTLLAMLLADPPISYTEIGEALGMPVGSIGPTRSRLLATLRRQVEAAGVTPSD